MAKFCRELIASCQEAANEILSVELRSGKSSAAELLDLIHNS
jgi:hypothetical protein